MFQLTFKTDNAAFHGADLFAESGRILRDIAEKVEGGWRDGVIRDLNGNKVGEWSLD